MISEIFRALRIGWAWACLRVSPESGISNFKLSCKTIYQVKFIIGLNIEHVFPP